MKIRVKGLEFFEGEQGDRPFKILAHGVVSVGDVTFNGVPLVYSSEGGTSVLAPNARIGTGARAVLWPSASATAKEIERQMIGLYERMGGKLPETRHKRQFVPLHELGFPDGASREEVVAALDRLSEERGVTCFTGTFEKPPVVPAERRPDVRGFLAKEASVLPGEAIDAADAAADRARRHAVAHASDEDDDTSGLHRTLGVDAIEETMARAGL